MTDPPATEAAALPPSGRAAILIGAFSGLVAGFLTGWLCHLLLATYVLWRTRPSLQPVAQTLGLVIAALLGATNGWRVWNRCRRIVGARTLRQLWADALANEARELMARPESAFAISVRRRPLVWSFGCVVVAYALVLSLHPPQLDIDDVYWWMYVAGFGMASAPDEHLTCSHHLLARGIAALYRTWPTAPWYGLYLEAVASVAHVAICYALARRLGSRGLVLFALQFLALDLYFVYRLQFTMEGGLCAVGGVLLLALGMSRGETHPWRHLCAGSALLFVASLVRVQESFLIVGVLGPVLLIEAWPLDRSRLARLGFIALVAAAMLGAEVQNRRFFQGKPDWRDFRRQCDVLRGELVEVERRPELDYTPATKPVFDEVGWCGADFRLLRSAVYYDDQRISDEKVAHVLERLPRPWRLHPVDNGEELLRIATDPRVVSVVPLLLVLLWGLRRQGWVALGAGLAVWCAATVYFLNFAKPPPERVYLPVVAGGLWTCAFFARSDVLPALPLFDWLHRPLTTLRQLLVAASLVAGAMNLAHAAHMGRVVATEAAELRASIARLGPRPDQLFVILGGWFPYKYLLPFDDIAFMRPMLILGTYHHSGFNKRRMREFGITDVYTALYERDDVRLVSTDELNRWLGESIARHHGVEVSFQPVFQDPRFTVYDVSRRGSR